MPAAIGVSLVGGLVGNILSQGDRNSQRKAMQAAVQAFENLGYPPDLSREIIFKEFQKSGQFTPELEQDLNDTVAESELGKLKEDPFIRQSQTQALQGLLSRGRVGLSAEDRAALNQIRTETQRDAEAKRQQILQSFSARGQGGAGAELVSQLQAGQAGTELASQQSDAVMAQAQQRALQSLEQSANVASGIRGQDFTAAQARAAAIDERNRFLNQNSIARQRANIGALNQAQQLNLKRQQDIADANIEMANKEKLRQSQEKGLYYDRGLQRATGISNAYTGQAGAYGKQAQQTAENWSNMGTGLAGMMLDPVKAISDKNLKEDIKYSDDEVNEFLEGLNK